MSLPSMNFLDLTVSEIQPEQTFSRQLPARPSGHHGWKQYPDSAYGLWGKNATNLLYDSIYFLQTLQLKICDSYDSIH